MKIEKTKRSYVDQNLNIDSWEVIKPFFVELLERRITSHDDYKKWLNDRSELDAVL